MEAKGGRGERVMIVEDDATVRTVVGDYLRGRGYRVTQLADGREASDALRADLPDVLVLDRMLPGVDGDELCRQVRERSDLPIIMLTALGSAGARIDGLERGADDYLAKPFAMRELQLRIAGLLRRRSEPSSPLAPFSVGPFRIDPATHRITRHGAEISLTAREYELFLFLLRNPDRVLSREDILRDVWGWSFGEPSTVTVHVRRLREKIECDPQVPEYLLTEWGAGYRFTTAGA
ncbi:response regulator transcription factor [Microbacterium sediminicola]|uniref:Response regulator transcription factor n=1 Tax=Microbacterium sediminicola TaxID=415210 RepID=A0ABN2I4X6_9MICO